MSLYDLGYRHSKVETEVEKDWEGICLASDNNRNQILRRLSVTQTGDAGSYRDGWIDNYIIDMGKTKEQAVSAYSRFINARINKFAPATTERGKRTAAEMETLVNMQAEAFGIEEKSLACQLSRKKLSDEQRARLSELNEVRERAIDVAHKRRRELEEATLAYQKAGLAYQEADEVAKEGYFFQVDEINVVEDASSLSLEEWGNLMDKDRGDIQKVQDFLLGFRSKVDNMELTGPNVVVGGAEVETLPSEDATLDFFASEVDKEMPFDDFEHGPVVSV
jgi:hypothetical protein